MARLEYVGVPSGKSTFQVSTHRVARLLAVALAHHLQVDDDGLVDADRLDLKGLLPLAGVLTKNDIN